MKGAVAAGPDGVERRCDSGSIRTDMHRPSTDRHPVGALPSDAGHHKLEARVSSAARPGSGGCLPGSRLTTLEIRRVPICRCSAPHCSNAGGTLDELVGPHPMPSTRCTARSRYGRSINCRSPPGLDPVCQRRVIACGSPLAAHLGHPRSLTLLSC